MFVKHRSLKLYFFTFILTLLAVSTLQAQFYRLEVKMADTTAYPGDTSRELSIFMKNWQDTIAAYQLVIYTSHPDVVQFTGEFDTSGTLTSSWELVSFAYYGSSMKLLAMANTIPPPYTPGIGYPQTGDIPLIKIKAVLDTLPDTMTAEYIDVIFSNSIHDFNFSDQAGNSIGLAYYEPTIDTGWYNCLEWAQGGPYDSLCLDWEEVPGPPADSMIIDTILNPYLDTAQVRISNGTITPIFDCIPGDLNNDYEINVLDLNYFINWLYWNGPPPECLASADINDDGVINLLDIVRLIDYLYFGGPPPGQAGKED